MIFVTVGTEKFPFDRLLTAIEEYVDKEKIKEEVFAQTGNSNYKPKSYNYKEFIGFNEVVNYIKRADIIISHAGIGSTLLCLNLGKVPIIFPRKFIFKEHLDNHQIEFAKKMESIGRVIVAYDPENLIGKINNYYEIVKNLESILSQDNKEKLIKYLKKISK